MEYSPEQNIVFAKYIKGDNVFVTGPGGTGKTELIRRIYNHALSVGKKIAVTALTGCAALLLECKARTIHSWASIGLGTKEANQYAFTISKYPDAKRNWTETHILIIDEVSMMSCKMFNLLYAIGQIIRKSNKPFGGLQLILSGDFFQLPPIYDGINDETKMFCFESSLWEPTFNTNQILLQKNFRQTDIQFTNILNQFREGIVKKSAITLMKQCESRDTKELSFEPVVLCPTRAKVDFINNSKMQLLNTEAKTFTMTKTTRTPVFGVWTATDIDYELKSLLQNVLCEETMEYKIDAQVMCITNGLSTDICNGSQGIITRFTDLGFPVVKFHVNDTEIIINYHEWVSERIPGVAISQIPLILSWAISIHKSQGLTITHANVDVGKSIFECGQTYVALSRLKSLDGLYLSSFDHTKIKINTKAQNYYKMLKERQEDQIQEQEQGQEEDQEQIHTIPMAIATTIDATAVTRIDYDIPMVIAVPIID